jgi:5-methylcytosine-specific restriction enzyme subunit McrC
LTPADCLGRLYNRLNGDYQPMHALCRFFLEHAGPTHARGANEMIPFLVEMPYLFELFVAEWLRIHLPTTLTLEPQYKMSFGKGDEVSIEIDLLVTETATGRPLWILDTKYKTAPKAASDDIQQVVAYAVAKGCTRAGLVYPRALETRLDTKWGQSGVSVKSLTFDLSGDLEAAGQKFLEELNSSQETPE